MPRKMGRLSPVQMVWLAQLGLFTAQRPLVVGRALRLGTQTALNASERVIVGA